MTETIQCEFLVDVCFFAVFEPNHHLWAPRHWAWVHGRQWRAEYHQCVLLRGRPGVVPVWLRGLRPLHRIQSLLPETERQHKISRHFRRMLRSQTRGILRLERYRHHGKNFFNFDGISYLICKIAVHLSEVNTRFILLFQTLICATSFATFAVSRKLPQNRLQLSITLMLTAVTFRLTTNANLPKISYHTRLVSVSVLYILWMFNIYIIVNLKEVIKSYSIWYVYEYWF